MLSGGSGALSLGCLGSCPCYGAGGQAAGWAVCSPTARISPLTSRWGSSRNARRSLLPTKGFSGALQPFRRARGGHGAGIAQGAQRGTAGSSTELSTAVPFPSRGAARGPQAPSSPYPRLGRGDTAVHTALPGAAGDSGTHNWASRAVPQCRRLQEMTDAGCCHLPKRCHPQNRTPPPPSSQPPQDPPSPRSLFQFLYWGSHGLTPFCGGCYGSRFDPGAFVPQHLSSSSAEGGVSSKGGLCPIACPGDPHSPAQPPQGGNEARSRLRGLCHPQPQGCNGAPGRRSPRGADPWRLPAGGRRDGTAEACLSFPICCPGNDRAAGGPARLPPSRHWAASKGPFPAAGAQAGL